MYYIIAEGVLMCFGRSSEIDDRSVHSEPISEEGAFNFARNYPPPPRPGTSFINCLSSLQISIILNIYIQITGSSSSGGGASRITSQDFVDDAGFDPIYDKVPNESAVGEKNIEVTMRSHSTALLLSKVLPSTENENRRAILF